MTTRATRQTRTFTADELAELERKAAHDQIIEDAMRDLRGASVALALIGESAEHGSITDAGDMFGMFADVIERGVANLQALAAAD